VGVHKPNGGAAAPMVILSAGVSVGADEGIRFMPKAVRNSAGVIDF